MNTRTALFIASVGICFATVTVARAVPCPCDGDVNSDGIVNIIDALVIENCKRGDCSGCLSSCDVNCDGVVDTLDVADDINITPSTWLCLFQGTSPAQCCPGASGACCDTTTGVCTNNVFDFDCAAAGLTWSEGLSCADVSCTGPPTGACCDLDRGTCQGDVIEADCAGISLVWSQGLACTAVSCPIPPNGACCNVGNGQCSDAVLEVDCTGVGLVWTVSTACSALTCEVPPQVPCPCDGDVNNDGVVNITDGLIIENCKRGDCSGCLSSCDVNCDGVVDTQDLADDINITPSTWLCLFQGTSPAQCCPGASGACCDTTTGVCTNNVFDFDCAAAGLTWSEGLSCTDVSCAGPPTGACCDLDRGTCQGDVIEADCAGISLVWSQGLACTAVSCPIPPNGACCNVGNGQCSDAVLEVDCTGVGLVWTVSTACSTLTCEVPPQVPCPCDGDVNNSGIVDITDAIAIENCKRGDCSGCLSSCDVNCDGAVDTLDLADDINITPSTWLCLFQGTSPDLCCFVDVDCDGNGVPDECDLSCLARGGACNVAGCGTSIDNNGNGIPDQCECPIATAAIAEMILNATGATVQNVKSRFLSFSGGDPGALQAVRVTFVSLPGTFSIFNDTTAWVDLPSIVSEQPGKGLADSPGTEPTFLAATLSPSPVFADWSTFGMVHVYDERIIPSGVGPTQQLEPATYRIQFVTDACDLSNETSFSLPLEITNARWADIAQLAEGEFRAADGIVGVDDTLSILAKFAGSANAPTKPRAELLGTGTTGPVAAIDGRITVGDLLAAIDAFSGGSYAFLPAVP